MSPKKENKAPTPSESTKNFEKRIVTDYFYSPTRSNMSSKERIEDLDRFLEEIMPLDDNIIASLQTSKTINVMSPKKENKTPTPSESTKTFVKIIRDDWACPPWERSATKSSMSSKDWSVAFKEVESLMSGEHDENISINF